MEGRKWSIDDNRQEECWNPRKNNKHKRKKKQSTKKKKKKKTIKKGQEKSWSSWPALLQRPEDIESME